MKLSSTLEVLAAVVAGLLAAFVVMLAIGCSSLPVEPQSAEIRGRVVIDTSAGPISVELSSGMLFSPGDSSARLRSIDVEAETTTDRGAVTIGVVTYPSQEWRRCLYVLAVIDGWRVRRDWGACEPPPEVLDRVDSPDATSSPEPAQGGATDAL